MHYWININGKQSGPILPQEIANLDFDPQTTYVWTTGMPNWQPIANVPELENIVRQKALQPKPVQPAPVDDEQIPEIPAENHTQFVRQPLWNDAPRQQQQQSPDEKPLWVPLWPAILVTVLCCHIVGILAIVWSVKASRNIERGNIPAAKSDIKFAEIMVIMAVMLGLFTMPFEVLSLL